MPGALGLGDALQQRQPHHRLRLQTHPLQEVRQAHRRLAWDLQKDLLFTLYYLIHLVTGGNVFMCVLDVVCSFGSSWYV